MFDLIIAQRGSHLYAFEPASDKVYEQAPDLIVWVVFVRLVTMSTLPPFVYLEVVGAYLLYKLSGALTNIAFTS